MRVIIAGPRDFTDYTVLCTAIAKSGFTITEVVSGCAAGVDSMGEKWAEEKGIRVKRFPADWKNLKAEGAVIKTGQYGKYNANAGFARNKQMAEYGEALIAIDTGSGDTGDMIATATKNGLKVFKYDPCDSKEDSDYEHIF